MWSPEDQGVKVPNYDRRRGAYVGIRTHLAAPDPERCCAVPRDRLLAARKALQRLVTHPVVEALVLGLILTSSICLALDNWCAPPPPPPPHPRRESPAQAAQRPPPPNKPPGKAQGSATWEGEGGGRRLTP